jgi:hypothetical protein
MNILYVNYFQNLLIIFAVYEKLRIAHVESNYS